MVGLADIPLVGKIVDRISEVTVDALFRGSRYMFCYKSLVQELYSEIEKVKFVEDRISIIVDAARNDGKIIYEDVLKWQTDVEELLESAQEIFETSKNRSAWRRIPCLPTPNPAFRFRLGREAARKVNMAIGLAYFGKNLLAREIAFLPPIENVPKIDNNFLEFQSRKDAYGEIWEALVTEGSSLIIGIYGMAGVGKTRIVEHIWEQAVERKIFDNVIRANVGCEKLNVIELQDQIAGHLNCKFASQDLERRASQLRNCFLNGGKILVILDDVWSKIPLHIIGIPCGEESGFMGCKILLTSRVKEVCLSNNCKHLVEITYLIDDEAWSLFSNTVGTSQIDSLQNESLAKAVCRKCGGSPLLIRAVGKALKFASPNSWKDALHQLENRTIPQLEKSKDESNAGVYALIKLSIDRIEDDAKSCLFLCSLFPEDAEIHMRKLIHLATGTQLVPNGESRIRAMVNILRVSSLLLDSEEDHIMRLHDLIRDVVRSMIVRDPNNAFLFVRCSSRLPDDVDYGSRKLLHLDLEGADVHFPDDLVCPNLHNLWLQCNNHIQQFSGSFYSMFTNLKFLLILEGTFSSLELQFSLQPLGKLTTLVLDNCDMTHIGQKNISFFPENLETLCIWNCHLPVPLDLPNQKYLRKLEIHSKQEVLMATNAMSSLSSLEELHIPNGFQVWRDELLNSNQLEVLESQTEKAKEVKLHGSTDTNRSSIFINGEAYTDLTNLYIEECNTMEYLVKMSQSEIQDNIQLRTSLSNLNILQIYCCSEMKYLFCSSVAKCLTQLQELSIWKCPEMVEIVMNESSNDGDIITLSKLKSLKLVGLPKLTSFYREKKEMHSTSTSTMDNSVQCQPLFDGMVVFPSLEELHIEDLEDTSDIWAKHDYDDNASSFCKLKRLKVSDCNKLKIVIPLAMLQYRLQNLEYLSIDSCSSVISEVGTYGSNAEVFPLEALRDMDLESLPCLTETKLNWREDSEALIWYPNLENLRICYCNRLRNVFLPSIARKLIHLKKVRVVGCKKMTEIIGAGKEKITDGTVVVGRKMITEITGAGEQEFNHVTLFPELTDLQLTRLPNLTSFCSSKVDFTYVLNFKPLHCPKLTWKR